MYTPGHEVLTCINIDKLFLLLSKSHLAVVKVRVSKANADSITPLSSSV
jgi:hypothetical protein